MEGLKEALDVATNVAVNKAPLRRSKGERARVADRNINVGNSERRVCGVVGSYLLARGFRRARTTTGMLGILLGGLLVRRAVSGHCELYQGLGTDSIT